MRFFDSLGKRKALVSRTQRLSKKRTIVKKKEEEFLKMIDKSNYIKNFYRKQKVLHTINKGKTNTTLEKSPELVNEG